MEKSKFPVGNSQAVPRAPEVTDLVIRLNNIVILLVQGRYYSMSADHALSLANALTINANQIKQGEIEAQSLRSQIKDQLKQ